MGAPHMRHHGIAHMRQLSHQQGGMTPKGDSIFAPTESGDLHVETAGGWTFGQSAVWIETSLETHCNTTCMWSVCFRRRNVGMRHGCWTRLGTLGQTWGCVACAGISTSPPPNFLKSFWMHSSSTKFKARYRHSSTSGNAVPIIDNVAFTETFPIETFRKVWRCRRRCPAN